VAGAPQRGASLRRAATAAEGSASSHRRRQWPAVLRQIPSCCAVSATPRPVAASRMIRARSALSVASSAPAPDRLVPVHVQPTVAPVKLYEPARYPPLPIERVDSHRWWIHTYGLKRRGFIFADTVANATRLAVAVQPSRQFRRGVLARLIQRIAGIPKRQLYKALNPRIDQVSRPPRPPDLREFRNGRTLWFPKPAAIRLSRC